MSNTIIGEGCQLDRVIVDKEARLERECVVGEGENVVNRLHPHLLDTGITVLGEKVVLPRGTRIGRNVLVFPGVGPADLPGSHVASGESLEPRTRVPSQGWS